MSNVTPLPPPAKPSASAATDAAMAQARVLAMRIMGAAMLPASLPVMRDAQMLQLAHRLGTIQTLAEALITQLGVVFPPASPAPQPGENQSA